jgi:S1-C subfamily serine protease
MRPAVPVIVLFTVAVTSLPGCIVVNKSTYSDDAYAYDPASSRKRIGVELGRVGEATAAQLRIDRDRATLITGVAEGSPAQRAGLQRFDIVTGVDGSDWASPSFLREAVHAKPAGEAVRLSILRGGQPIEVAVDVESVSVGSIYN